MAKKKVDQDKELKIARKSKKTLIDFVDKQGRK